MQCLCAEKQLAPQHLAAALCALCDVLAYYAAQAQTATVTHITRYAVCELYCVMHSVRSASSTCASGTTAVQIVHPTVAIYYCHSDCVLAAHLFRFKASPRSNLNECLCGHVCDVTATVKPCTVRTGQISNNSSEWYTLSTTSHLTQYLLCSKYTVSNSSSISTGSSVQ
jgi:hypothetical protein